MVRYVLYFTVLPEPDEHPIAESVQPHQQNKLYAEIVLLRDYVRRHLAAEENTWLSYLVDVQDFASAMQELSFVDENTAYIMDKMQENIWLLDLHVHKLAATVDLCSYGSLEPGGNVFPCLAFIWSSLFEAISRTCTDHDEEAFLLGNSVLILTTSINKLEEEHQEQALGDSLNVTRFGILLIHLMALCVDLIRWTRDMPAEIPQFPAWPFDNFERRISDREEMEAEKV
ncbi:hypothetical protein MAPG_06150 [Magnaporthiopsis poae ATCC 64411]|uniref:Uncharacterized protein n=1 Tax=Magnaporthiopsis poae (strain ATCC 64411 / 73-15) TaxID=644358 RepID=A0A0C4E196_MAGP6|nr:hypothetical protein MAPG_06150 [Magnaporthiopsis poae ATCC 64411]